MAMTDISIGEVRPMRRYEWGTARDLLGDAYTLYPLFLDVHPDKVQESVDALTEDYFVDDSEGRSVQTFFAERAGRIVGMVVATEMTNEELELAGLYVFPHEQGRGLGTMMIRSVVSHAESLGVNSVYLRVTSANSDARELYIREGFSPEWPPEIQASKVDPAFFVEKLVKLL